MGFPPLLLIFVFSSMSSSFLVHSRPVTIMSATVAKSTITVSQSDQADFRKIQDAVDAVPSYNGQWIRIRVSAGVYREKVEIPREKPYIYIEGEGSDKTIIKWNDYGETAASGSFISAADYFVARGIAFENYYNTEGDNEMAPAPAATISGDKSAFFDCSFVGVQDTLVDVRGRHYFSNCYIEGFVDFICGNGQSFFENCEIKVNGKEGGCYITAQKRESMNESSGFVFYGGRVSGTKAFLGRAWGRFSRVVFQKTDFDLDVEPQGWDAWFQPSDGLLYLEQECSGKGSDTSQRVPWSIHNIPEDELRAYTRANFINDEWLKTLPGV